jgi:predicted metalloprotease with PDZ domain
MRSILFATLFALAASTATAAPAQLLVPPATGGEKADAKPQRGYLGVVADDREDRGRGVRVIRVHPGSPAEKAGLKAGDLIVDLGSIRIRQLSDAAGVLEQVAPDGVLAFEVLRGEKRLRMDVKFGPWPADKPASAAGAKKEPARPATAPSVELSPQMSDRQLLEKLLQRIEELERRVEALERGAAPRAN